MSSDGSMSRIRTLSARGKQFYEQTHDDKYDLAQRAWTEVDNLLGNIDSCTDYDSLNTLKASIEKCADRHSILVNELIDFCVRTKTVDSLRSADKHKILYSGSQVIVDAARRRIEVRLNDLLWKDENKSHTSHMSKNSSKSRSSHHTRSTSSSVTSFIMRSKAKAEAAKAKLLFAEKEAEIKRRQALLEQKQTFDDAKIKREKTELSVDLELLTHKRDLAVAKAEVEASEQASQFLTIDNVSQISPLDNRARTQDYVDNNILKPNCPAVSSLTPDRDVNEEPEISEHFYRDYQPSDLPLNPKADEFIPQPQVPISPVRDRCETREHVDKTVMSDFTRYLLKKDLLLSRLSCFDDRPENFRTWKLSFKTVMSELQGTALEEIDPLLKYSGPESRKHILSIKASNITDPVKGLQRVWERLEERFGCPEMLEASLKRRVELFPKLTAKDNKKLYELSDLVSEIESIKDDVKMRSLFAYFDSSTGVNQIVNKLPHFLQQKWTNEAVKYMNEFDVAYPSFSYFAKFLRDQSRVQNNPSFVFDSVQVKKDARFPSRPDKVAISVKKTDTNVTNETLSSDSGRCPLHHSRHSLNKCKAFRSKHIEERRKFLKDKNICFKCCDSSSHMRKDCRKPVKCGECQSDRHPSALHVDIVTKPSEAVSQHGGESNPLASIVSSSGTVTNSCTRICGDSFHSKSCAKIVLANVYSKDNPDKALRLYVMVDDQSNKTLANVKFFDTFGVNCHETEYVLSSCSGKVRTSGRRVGGLVVESLDKSVQIDLPIVTECSQVPDNREEIPTFEVAKCYPHLHDIVQFIPQLDNEADIMLLIGRDLIEAHYVLDHRIGPANTPYAQKLPLGWTIIGESCLGNLHLPTEFNVKKTHILTNGRDSLFEPCVNQFKLQEKVSDRVGVIDTSSSKVQEHELLGQHVFVKTKDDEKPGLSMDDRAFLRIMEDEFRKDEDGNWICPLPFRENRPRLQNNYMSVLKRAKTLDKSLHKDSVKKQHFLSFMDKMLKNGHAERAPTLGEGEECWYIPIFSVYHPRKPDSIRIVFDSAAKFNGIALNDVLLSGPDFTNSLIGVLMRFRREPVAVVADIQQMFYCFQVTENHRNFLRFIWHEDNDLNKPLVDYRMRVHIFGSTASPAVATYGLRLAAARSTLGRDVTAFVQKDFYVDDGLTSLATVEHAVDLLRRTQQVLMKEGNLRLHKIASNVEEVMTSFPAEDLARDMKDLDLGTQMLPVQRSLGVMWNLETDMFMFQISDKQKSYTRRGVLSSINSIFDPLGFLAPVIIEGKLLLRKLAQDTSDWDDPMPPQFYSEWDQWICSLQDLHELRVPRSLLSTSFSNASNKSVHVFSDASERAIAAVGYLRSQFNDDSVELGFIMGKSKVSPQTGHTIPRLELCAAVLAVEVAESISKNLDLPVSDFTFYSDSKEVLGYIYNQSRRFYTYVANRVQRIRSSTEPQQWRYVPSENNPADKATRSIPASELGSSSWINGPTFLLKDTIPDSTQCVMQSPDEDKEVRPVITTLKSNVTSTNQLGSHRFERFSQWMKLVNAIAILRHVAQCYSSDSDCHGWHVCSTSHTVDGFHDAQNFVLREVQKDVYKDEYDQLTEGKPVSKSSSVFNLCPFIDNDGLLRVGGRLKHSSLSAQEKHPILVPGRHHISALIVRHYHAKVQHQGRHITEGAIRSAGIWITGAKSVVSSIIRKCVKCRRLRGVLGHQKMADLPADRLEPSPPFTNVGVDCFGPWLVVSRRTRGGQASSKRWGVLFTCLSTRAVHIEVVEELSSSSFINALRNFIALRGPVRLFRSDQGTNFIGSTSDLQIQSVNVDDKQVKEFLYQNGTTWLFNPPHASHMGGVWERMIRITRNILDSLLSDLPGGGLTHEVLTTFLAEASAIINSRPLVPLTSDPDEPLPLTPALILNQKPHSVGGFVETFDIKNMYRKQWKRVQTLAEMFWNRWRIQYLQSLQSRRKWVEPQRNFSKGDVVLLKDKQCVRNEWPMGIVQEVFPSADGMIRKVEVRVVKQGGPVSTYVRPVTELVLLLSDD